MKDFIEELKLKNLLKEEKKSNKWVIVLAVIGGFVLLAAVVYALYRFFAPDYLEDFENEFEDEFDDDFFEDEDDDSLADDVFAED